MGGDELIKKKKKVGEVVMGVAGRIDGLTFIAAVAGEVRYVRGLGKWKGRWNFGRRILRRWVLRVSCKKKERNEVSRMASICQ